MKANNTLARKQVVRKICCLMGKKSLKRSNRVQSRLKAARAVLGIWANKDTSFFDR